jgi:hypothetical protein
MANFSPAGLTEYSTARLVPDAFFFLDAITDLPFEPD